MTVRSAAERRGNALLMQTQIFASRARKHAHEKTLGFFASCGAYRNSESRLFQGPAGVIRVHFSNSNVEVSVFLILVRDGF